MSDLRDSLVQSGTLVGYLNTIVYAHNYNDLSNKPQINGVTLQGDVTPSELGLVTPATEAVQSVNGETGNVVLDGNDIDYDSTKTINQQIDAVAASINYPVTSVNEKTGAVVLDGMDIDYDSSYTINQKIDAVAADIPVVPVQSVNGETGDVVLDGDDIAYNSSLSVNQKIDAVESSIPVVDYPVTSVAGKTGAVELYASDIMIQDTASGAVASFTTSLVKPLVNCTTEAGATTVTRCGKNLIDTSKLGDGYISGTGSIIQPSATSQQKYTNYFPCKENDIVTITTAFPEPHEAWIAICYYDNAKGFISRDAETMANVTTYSRTLTIPNGVSYFIVTYRTYGSITNQLEVGPTATAYEAYNGTDYPISDIDIITTLQGVNNIWAVIGDISVTYLETIKEYIDKAVAT